MAALRLLRTLVLAATSQPPGIRAVAADPRGPGLANDWSALPLGWRLAARWNAPLILDLHEYAPLEWEEQWKWRLFAAPMTVYFLRHYAVH
ncbi:MAG: hypothetical protein D6735_14655, partial [Acidobacteria bacterium]